MSLQISTIVFDTYEGPIRLPMKRVNVFAPAHVQHIGSQQLPSVGRQFTLRTTRFQDPSTNRATANTLDAMKGTIVAIVQDGLDFAVTHSVNFLVEDVDHEMLDVIPGVVGYRSTGLINLAPAGRIVSKWTLRAVPSS